MLLRLVCFGTGEPDEALENLWRIQAVGTAFAVESDTLGPHYLLPEPMLLELLCPTGVDPSCLELSHACSRHSGSSGTPWR